MPETIIESAISGKLERDLIHKWLNNESIEAAPEDCILFCSNRNEFTSFFLSYLRNQTDSILQTNSNALPIPHQGTPEKSLGQRKHHRSISDPTCDNDTSNDSLTVKSDRKTQESPNRDRKKPGRRVKTKLFADDKKDHNTSLSSDESRISIGVERLIVSSTPVKNGFKPDYPNLPSSSPVTPQSRSFKDFERCDTPRVSRHYKSQDKSVSLADYLVNVQPKSAKKKRSKNTSNEDSEIKIDLDLSNSEIFPEIGARKSSSLKSERRRINPTNIDRSKKSYSLNSFTPEAFQQPSPLALEENLAFKPKLQPKELSSSIEIERNILKQERHKLMEKFNILNTTSSPKVTTPQIKILQKDSSERNQNFIEADTSKVVLSDKIDILIDIYNVLLKNNLILSINTEIYFLITILLSKQLEDDCRIAESQLQNNLYESILKPIHNSTYFAVKSLWNQRSTLEVILDKNSLKILGENKKVRSFYPDLAKFLLNSYGLKCEAESNSDKSKSSENRTSNGIVCFNHETDNAENFPSILSFQNFKKQRDMFYEILRWYEGGGGGVALRSRARSLLALAARADNHAHLAALLMRMLLDTPVPESKLSKLQRRLTCPSATESHRLPHFTDKEMFYKEFIMYSENESFRVHMKDALASEIIALDSTPICNDSSNGSDSSRELLILSKKLCLLSKFLGYLTSLPYVQTSVDVLLKSGALISNTQKDDIFSAPKEKVLENNLALRNYSQPAIDLKEILKTAIESGRMTVTVPWMVHYLSMLDYTTLRLKYYQNLLNYLFYIYETVLRSNDVMKKNTIIYLKSILGWLFDLPHFPQDFFNSKKDLAGTLNVSSDGIDMCVLIDEPILFELCPFLRDVNVLLSTSRVNHEKESFRHITPVSLSSNTDDRIRNKEKELQSRLEEELVRSQPPSSRRVLELVSERVCAAAVRELAATLAAARTTARAAAAALVARSPKGDIIEALRTLYNEHLERLRSSALSSCKTLAKERVSAALTALLPAAPAPLHAVATRTCYSRLSKWIHDHWTSTDVLCKDIEQELWSLRTASEPPRAPPAPAACLRDLCSPAAALIALKEQICLLLDYEEISTPAAVLQACVNSCSPNNVFNRAPTQRAFLQLSIDFCVVYVSRKTSKVSEILPNLHELWHTCCPERPRRSPDAGAERAPSPPRGGDRPASADEVIEIPKQEVKEIKPEETNSALEYFDRILCPRNIVLLSETRCRASDVWEALADVLVFLLKNDYLSEDSLTEQCLAVYRQDWPQNILENLSTCMKSVSSRWSKSSSGKFTLFLDFLADYCNDMDYDIVELN